MNRRDHSFECFAAIVAAAAVITSLLIGCGDGSTQSASSAGGSNVCEPRNCVEQGFACGMHSDGCGNQINCGICDDAAGPGCNCVGIGLNCGASAACGGIDCGQCPVGQICGLVTPNVCADAGPP